MRGKVILLKNEFEISQAEKLGLMIPDMEYIEYPIIFDINSVEAAHLNCEENIVIYLKTAGSFVIKYDEIIFSEIDKYLIFKK